VHTVCSPRRCKIQDNFHNSRNFSFFTRCVNMRTTSPRLQRVRLEYIVYSIYNSLQKNSAPFHSLRKHAHHLTRQQRVRIQHIVHRALSKITGLLRLRKHAHHLEKHTTCSPRIYSNQGIFLEYTGLFLFLFPEYPKAPVRLL